MDPVPPAAAAALRPILPALSEETIAAIGSEVPDYHRAMEGAFGALVRLGVETAYNRFVDRLEHPRQGEAGGVRETYVNLGRGEFHAGRSLDALLAAYRLGARLAWRRFVEAGVEAELEPAAIYALGEAIFAYIDELSAASVEGYADEQTRAAGESQRRRRRLARALGEDAPAEAVRTAAADAGWRLPASIAAVVVTDEGSDETLEAAAQRLARSLGPDALGAAVTGAAVVWVPDPVAPGAARQIETAAGSLESPARVAIGPAVDWADASTSLRRALATWRLAPEATGVARSDDHLGALLLRADPALAAELCEARLAPLAGLSDRSRKRLTETLLAWLDRPGQVQAVAAVLGVHPQTVRYRVRQLRDLFGARLEDPDARFELALALRVARADLSGGL